MRSRDAVPVKIWRRKGLLINGILVVILLVVGITSYLVLKTASSSTTLVTSTVRQERGAGHGVLFWHARSGAKDLDSQLH